jgi:hypothetical protein
MVLSSFGTALAGMTANGDGSDIPISTIISLARS